jgi:hypothetical protein
MKRCPECQFLYENESALCDMDGTPLRYTVALPSLPGLAKSIWDKWTIALLCAVVLSTVLVILYRATPRAYTEAAGQMKSTTNEMPPAKQNAPPAESTAPSESSEPEQAVDAADVSDRERDPFESQSPMTGTKAQKSKRASSLADATAPPPAAVNHFEPVSNPPTAGTSSTAAKPATSATTAGEKSANQTSSQTPSSATSSTSAHPKPPETYSNKADTPNQKPDSGVKSFFKKAGKVLKKPFGEN